MTGHAIIVAEEENNESYYAGGLSSGIQWLKTEASRQMRKSKTAFFMIGSFILFLFWQFNENRIIEIQIPTAQGQDIVLAMPRKDKKNLEYLFHKMIAMECAGYTLLGNKPMHMNGFLKPIFSLDWRLSLDSLNLPNYRMRCAWETWEKWECTNRDSLVGRNRQGAP